MDLAEEMRANEKMCCALPDILCEAVVSTRQQQTDLVITISLNVVKTDLMAWIKAWILTERSQVMTSLGAHRVGF
jgi:hypothetical protein